MSLLRYRVIVFFVPLLLALPFMNRAYFVDDSYFVEIASWLKDHPQQPYDFLADDAGLQNRGWEKNGFVRMVNPLAHHYYLALLLKLGGEREFFLRAGSVLLSCFSALFLFEFARRWTRAPFLSTFLILVTPAQWLTSYSLLIDSTLVFFAFGSIYFFIRATEVQGMWRLVASGVFAGLGILSKYPGVFVLPLMGVWLFLRWKKIDRPWTFLLPPLLALVFLLGYSVWTSTLYGRPHILAASERMVHLMGWPKLFIFLVFFSGSMLIPLVVWPYVERRLRLISSLLVMALTFALSSEVGGFSLGQAFLLGMWLVTSVLFLGSIWASRPQWIFPRDHFLFFWIVGYVAMMLLVMDWVAVRYYCLVTPAAVIFAVRLMEMRWGEASSRILAPVLAVTFLFTGGLALADYRQAEPVRLVRKQLQADGFLGGERHFYLGDSFTMSYLKKDGWVPCFPQTVFQAGDLVLAKEVTMPLIWFARKPVVLKQVASYEYPSRIPLKVMDFSGSAGFYASVWGALPFTFSTGPWERFHLYEIIGPS